MLLFVIACVIAIGALTYVHLQDAERIATLEEQVDDLRRHAGMVDIDQGPDYPAA